MKIVDGVNYTNWSREQFENLKKTGVNLVHVSIVYWENTLETIEVFKKWDTYFQENGDLITKIETVTDINNAEIEGKVGILIGWQNSAPIDSDLGLLKFFFKQGLRVMQLTYNNQSYIASGCYENNDSKITRFGKEVIQEMNRLGIAIDLSHINNESGLEAVKLSKKPVCVSHSIPVFSKKSERNISTELMKSVAKSGGILGLSLYPLHVKNGSDCTLNEYCKLIEDTISIMGIDHIGIGSDLCTDHPDSVLQWMRCGKWLNLENQTDTYYKEAVWPKPMSWFKEIGDIHNLAAGMEAYGFKKEEIEKLMGLNWIRFMEAVLPN
ncbi:dipeptidase [Polaribacter sp.]|nr:dipeptidase [Polaribacter sp.]